MDILDFKTLFIYYNDRMRTYIPLNISYLSAGMQKAGFPTAVFDTSFYTEHKRLLDEKKKEDAGIFKSVDYKSIGVKIKSTKLNEDLIETIIKEKPSLVAFSVFSQTKEENLTLAKIVKKHFPDIKIIMGGIHINIAPEEVLKNDFIDYIAIGEGEGCLIDLANALAKNKPTKDIPNLGYKKKNNIIINKCRGRVSLDNLPFPDWDNFQEYQQYSPFRGKLLKMAIVEFSRYCPYNCTYCGNDIIRKKYKSSNINIKYTCKSPEKWISELQRMKDHYGTEFINIADGTFVAQSEKSLERVCDLYTKQINLPFFCDATVHCITKNKAKLLKKMGCICVNIGLECANEEYRKKYLDRFMSNKQIVESFLICSQVGLKTRSYNILGLPFTTRKDVMDTIALNRKCKVESASLSIFMPYEGTKLRELCISNGLVNPNQNIIGDGTYPIIKNADITDEELIGLYNTFVLYIFAPKKLYPIIKLAEENTKASIILRNELIKIYA